MMVNRIHKKVQQLWLSKDGQDLIEYALLAAAGAVAVAAVMPDYLIPLVSNVFSKIVSQAILTCSIG